MTIKTKYGIGARHFTNESCEIEVIEEIKGCKRRIRFKNGYEIIVSVNRIARGNIKNPYHTSVLEVGYLGVGKYEVSTQGKTTVEYRTWKSMLQRCYDEKYQEKNKTYVGISICDEWHNFQNFAKFYNENYPKIENVIFEIDKDLLQQSVENKIYSKDACVFLPKKVNRFLSNKKKKFFF